MNNKLRSVAFIFITTLSVAACHQTASHGADTALPDSSSATPANSAVQTSATSPGGGAAMSTFILPGYTLLDTASGDLNLDNFPDAILILKKPDEDSTSDVVDHPEKRPLLLLTGTPGGGYTLSARSDNAVYCVDCGGMMGDPYTGVTIKKGFFSVEHYGGSGERWTRIITFKYSPSDHKWYLFKDGGDSFYAADPEKVTTHVRTAKDFGKLSLEQFDIYKEE